MTNLRVYCYTCLDWTAPVWVHGHEQCARCTKRIHDCCEGEKAETAYQAEPYGRKSEAVAEEGAEPEEEIQTREEEIELGGKQ